VVLKLSTYACKALHTAHSMQSRRLQRTFTQRAQTYTNFCCCTSRAPEVVKHVCAVAPHVDRAVFAQALVIEAVHLCSSSSKLSGYTTCAGGLQPTHTFSSSTDSCCVWCTQQPSIHGLPHVAATLAAMQLVVTVDVMLRAEQPSR
jgi:hypothetical protein